jgi:hypothetical protein
MSPRSKARPPAERSFVAPRRASVDRAEVGEVAERLLEVVAQDLLELRLAIAAAVDPVGPVDESLVERGPRALEHAVVGRVPNEDVLEAERRLRRILLP